jgi:glycosyltransferase involved in cell wall biosynthesis
MSQPDVIHAHWLYEYAAASLGYQPDALVTAHDAPVSVLRHYHHPYWLFRELLGLRSLRHVINLTAVAPQLRNELVRLAPRASTISVVPNGIELTSGDHAVRKVRKASKPVFACIANGFDRRKNTAAVIKAFHSVVQKLPEAELRLYGAGHGGNEEAHVWSRKHGLDRNLSYKGLTSHEQIKADLKDTIDIIVHPSKWEACSLAILEARSYGIPVIGGAKSGGVPYTLDQGGAGMVIDRLHVSNLESAMLKLAQDQDAYKRISSRALAGLNPTFNLANVASTYLILLENIYRSRGVPRNASG